MRNDILLNSDNITCESTAWEDDFFESVFFNGNGRIGIRGYLPCRAANRPLQCGLYISGIFEEIKDGITDIVHLPSPVFEEALIDDDCLVPDGMVQRRLDLRTGIFSAEYTLARQAGPGGASHVRQAAHAAWHGNGETGRIRVCHERFSALDNVAYIVQRSTLTAESDIAFTWHSGINLAARNSPVPDDQVKSNDEIMCLFVETAPLFQSPSGKATADGGEAWARHTQPHPAHKQALTLDIHTPMTGLRLTYDCSIDIVRAGNCIAPTGDSKTLGHHKHQDPVSYSQGHNIYIAGEWAGFAFHLALKKGESITIEKICHIASSRDVRPFTASNDALNHDKAVMSHRAAWEKRWQGITLPALPDTESATAARYMALQLVMNASADDETVSIGARGLTHARYKGCYFWDTDFFLLPFYIRTHPPTARNLVRYRILNLPAARAHAEKTSAPGARYPWMASLTGAEQCESWDIGLAEVHITADVVFAIDNYIKESGDDTLYPEAAEVYVETARFWVDRCTREAEGGVANLLFVKGPDEYCGITNNNLFTNMLVKHNLTLACEAAAYLHSHEPALYKRLALTEEEAKEWQSLAEALPLARNPRTGRLQQDDSFHLLEAVDPATLKDGDGASYHHVAFDRLQRYQVIKQADLLLLMTRMPESFTAEEKLAAWRDYEPLCLHDSTLSFASHALFAAQNGLREEAERYLKKALFLDLRDIMGNTGKEGLHLANFGECWQALLEFSSAKC